MNSKKLQHIEGIDGLQASYGGGDYNACVWEAEWDEYDEDGDIADVVYGYEIVYFRSNFGVAFERKNVRAEDLETEMRKIQPDLRKWRKAEYGEI